MNSSCESIKKSIEESLYGRELSWFYNCKKTELLQSDTKSITKWDILLLLQSGTTVITKWDGFFYYKVGQLLLQSGTILSESWTGITKTANYYKVVLNKRPLRNWYCYNHFYDILRLFDVLPIFPFTISEKMRDYYLSIWYIRFD